MIADWISPSVFGRGCSPKAVADPWKGGRQKAFIPLDAYGAS
jgi:hypothetical protein